MVQNILVLHTVPPRACCCCHASYLPLPAAFATYWKLPPCVLDAQRVGMPHCQSDCFPLLCWPLEVSEMFVVLSPYFSVHDGSFWLLVCIPFMSPHGLPLASVEQLLLLLPALDASKQTNSSLFPHELFNLVTFPEL
eukprot:1159202-Pelagomonas_calceolata.AAC.2